QTALTNRVSTVETLADGTKTTVAELSKTVSKATGDIASVSSRTKTVEDTLSQTRTQYEALTQAVNGHTGQIDSINRKTADLQSGIDGVTERFENLRVGGENLLTGTTDFSGSWLNSYSWTREAEKYRGLTVMSRSGEWLGISQAYASEINETYTFSCYIKSSVETDTVNCYFTHPTTGNPAVVSINSRSISVSNVWKRISVTFSVTRAGNIFPRIERFDRNARIYIAGLKLERGTVATDWSTSDEDLRSEMATYKRTAEESSAELSRQIQLADGKAVEAKTYAQQTAEGFKTRLESLETYKDGESTRANQYLSASRTETAKQLTAERTAIANNYVAKSTYDEDARGTTLKLNEIKTTADTAKQNLATYQNTVDRKLTELTTSTQTLDRKISTASTKVDTVAGQIRTEISNVETKIPTSIGGRNLFKGSRDFSGVWYNAGNGSFFEEYKDVHIHRTKTAWLGKSQRISVKSGEIYTFSFYAKSDSENDGIMFYLLHSETGTPAQGHPNNKYIAISTDYQRYSITIKIASDGIIVPRLERTNTTNFLFFGGFKLETGAIPTDWSPAPEDLVTVTALHSVKDTVDSHTRTIGAVGTAGSILDNVSKVTQTAAGLVQEVSGANGLKTQVSTLAGSYAIKNLTKAGDVLGQINLNKDGSIKLDGSLVQITGKTYIQDGVITSAKIAGLDAGKITTGTLDAARIAVNSIDGSKMVFDQAFVNKMTANEAYLKQIFAKNAFITRVQAVTLSANKISGGILTATNGAMAVNLSNGQILYYTNQAAMKRILTGYPTQFIKFDTGTYGGKPGGVTVIGSNRDGSENPNNGSFAGIRIWNGIQSDGSFFDKMDIGADDVQIGHKVFDDGNGTARGWHFRSYGEGSAVSLFPYGNYGRATITATNYRIFNLADNTYVNLEEVLNKIFDNFNNLNNNGNYQRSFYSSWR
ncbi:hypothetical protein HO939_09310, partial [Streptococcus suis]|nr:hypothetical protein [Streptococcus suis]